MGVTIDNDINRLRLGRSRNAAVFMHEQKPPAAKRELPRAREQLCVFPESGRQPHALAYRTGTSLRRGATCRECRVHGDAAGCRLPACDPVADALARAEAEFSIEREARALNAFYATLLDG